jgi:hypothetical protein
MTKRLSIKDSIVVIYYQIVRLALGLLQTLPRN